jgi:hypothetical protein
VIPSGRRGFDAVPGWLLGASVTLITMAMLALVGFGRAAYKDRNKRRTLGILWDVGTFWPRATHPLAPPSYGERVMPDLLTRAEHLTPNHTAEVIVSGHSQGAIIAAALVLQLDDKRKQACLLTYGNPLRRLYSLYFPGYFGLATLQYLGTQLGPTRHNAAPTRPGVPDGRGATSTGPPTTSAVRSSGPTRPWSPSKATTRPPGITTTSIANSSIRPSRRRLAILPGQ